MSKDLYRWARKKLHDVRQLVAYEVWGGGEFEKLLVDTTRGLRSIIRSRKRLSGGRLGSASYSVSEPYTRAEARMALRTYVEHEIRVASGMDRSANTVSMDAEITRRVGTLLDAHPAYASLSDGPPPSLLVR